MVRADRRKFLPQRLWVTGGVDTTLPGGLGSSVTPYLIAAGRPPCAPRTPVATYIWRGQGGRLSGTSSARRRTPGCADAHLAQIPRGSPILARVSRRPVPRRRTGRGSCLQSLHGRWRGRARAPEFFMATYIRALLDIVFDPDGSQCAVHAVGSSRAAHDPCRCSARRSRKRLSRSWPGRRLSERCRSRRATC